jgi:hypothetical protein
MEGDFPNQIVVGNMNLMQSIVYSNSEYFDVLKIFLHQEKKYKINSIIFSDVEFENYTTLIYSNELPYAQRLISCLEQLDSEIILYQHEDMFLYQQPNFERLSEYIDFLKNSRFSFLRLCRTGNCCLKQIEINFLFEIDSSSPDFFAVQPTIWKRKDFIKYLKNRSNLSIWDLERYGNQNNNEISGLMHFEYEPNRGGHFDSFVWPYIATAIVKGKWNITQYSKELDLILNESNIDIEKRSYI